MPPSCRSVGVAHRPDLLGNPRLHPDPRPADRALRRQHRLHQPRRPGRRLVILDAGQRPPAARSRAHELRGRPPSPPTSCSPTPTGTTSRACPSSSRSAPGATRFRIFGAAQEGVPPRGDPPPADGSDGVSRPARGARGPHPGDGHRRGRAALWRLPGPRLPPAPPGDHPRLSADARGRRPGRSPT